MFTLVKLVATLVARPGKADDLKALLDGMIGPSRAEPGNLRWDIWQDASDSNRYILDELYTNSDAVAAHRATPHFQNYLSKINDVAERSVLVLTPVEIS